MTRETKQWERCATRNSTTTSINVTETVVLTLSATELLAPSTYMVDVELRLTGTTGGEIFQVQLREDTVSGAIVDTLNYVIPASGIAITPFPWRFGVPVTVSTPVSKAYVVTLQLASGAGSIRAHAKSRIVVRRVGDDEVVKVSP